MQINLPVLQRRWACLIFPFARENVQFFSQPVRALSGKGSGFGLRKGSIWVRLLWDPQTTSVTCKMWINLVLIVMIRWAAGNRAPFRAFLKIRQGWLAKVSTHHSKGGGDIFLHFFNWPQPPPPPPLTMCSHCNLCRISRTWLRICPSLLDN